MQDDDDLEGDVEALKLEDDSPVAKKKPETTNFTATAATKPPEEMQKQEKQAVEVNVQYVDQQQQQ